MFLERFCVTRRWTGSGLMPRLLQTLRQLYTGRCCSVRSGRRNACSCLRTERS